MYLTNVVNDCNLYEYRVSCMNHTEFGGLSKKKKKNQLPKPLLSLSSIQRLHIPGRDRNRQRGEKSRRGGKDYPQFAGPKGQTE